MFHASGSIHKPASYTPEKAKHGAGAVHNCCCIVLEPHCVRAVDATRRPAAEMSAPPCWAESDLTSDCQPVLVFCDCDCVHSYAINPAETRDASKKAISRVCSSARFAGKPSMHDDANRPPVPMLARVVRVLIAVSPCMLPATCDK